MRNKKLIILIVLGIAAVFSLIYGIVTPPKGRRRASSKPKTVRRGEKVKSAAKIIPAKRHAKKTKFVFWARNPFAPKEIPRVKVVRLALNGILWDEENPKAIINNVIVTIGDKIGENTVIEIKKDRVILNDGISDFELGL